MKTEASYSFVAELSRMNQQTWDQVLEEVLPFVHAVDQQALRVWWSFWPLRLCTALEKSADPQETARKLELDGRYNLSDQIDSSIEFFYAARHWPSIKKALLEVAHSAGEEALSLTYLARQIAGKAAALASVDQDLLLGLSTAGLMLLRQSGVDALRQVVDQPATRLDGRSPHQILKARSTSSRGWFDFLKGAAKKHHVVWDERRGDNGRFLVRSGQDLSSAAAEDSRDYRSVDTRRIDGPIPAQCRSAACGYCWIGILAGRENLSEMTAFEERRLRYFGYRPRDESAQAHPPIRLACQSKCKGNLTLTVPPWNGVLDGQR